MGTASLIASAVGILLLVVTAYVLVGGTIMTAEVVTLAQQDSFHAGEARMRTAISITNTTVNLTTSTLSFDMRNTGGEIIGDFDHMDVFVATGGVPLRCPQGTGAGTWSLSSIEPDDIHPSRLDPDEVAIIAVAYTGTPPTWVKASTSTGVSASAYV